MDHQCEYESLRNEIISMEELQRNVWIYMYVLFCALFVLGLQWSTYLFLVTYVILIPFQCIINDYSWSITKLSTYIRVFFENERDSDMHWESLHVYDAYQKYYKEKSNSLIGIIRISGSIHLGLLATGFFCIYTLKNAYEAFDFVLSVADILFIVFSLFLLFILVIICKDFNKEHSFQLEPIMEEYKNRIKNKDSSEHK